MHLRGRKTFAAAAIASMALFALPQHHAAAISRSHPGFAPLDAIYYTRPDLIKLFDENTWRAFDPKTAPYPTLVAWAEASGYIEYPTQLKPFAPIAGTSPAIGSATTSTSTSNPPFKNLTTIAPKKTGTTNFSPTAITAKAVYVVDVNSETSVLEINADKQYPIASLTKLMTATVALEKGFSLNGSVTMSSADEVGGARISVKNGARLRATDVFYAMLVGSANNATNAVARATKITKSQFVTAMNAKAKAMGLTRTSFADPTGIELENISTPKEMAYLALRAYENPTIKRATTTAQYRMSTAHTIKNTNGLLIDNTNGLYVLGGKTGYLPEIGWNLTVKLRDNKGNRPLLITLMGSGDRPRSFEDAETIAHWVWDNYQWK